MTTQRSRTAPTTAVTAAIPITSQIDHQQQVGGAAVVVGALREGQPNARDEQARKAGAANTRRMGGASDARDNRG